MTTGEFHACLESNANLQTNKASKEVIPTISQHFVHSMKWKKKRVPKWKLERSQFSSVQLLSCVRLFCDPMNRSTPGLPVHHQLPESTQTH